VKRVVIATVAGLTLTACVSLDDYTGDFAKSDAPRSSEESGVTQKFPEGWAARQLVGDEPSNWLASFDDAQLSALVEEALRENFEVAVSREAVVQAIQQRISTFGANLLPSVDGAFGFSRSEQVFETDQQIFLDPQGLSLIHI